MLKTEKQETELSHNMKGFLFFWSGQLGSILGSSIVQFVLAWWITVETESALLLSLATFIAFVPTILLTPIAGVLIDKWKIKPIIGGADFLQAATTVVLLFLFWYDLITVSILLIFLAVRGVFQAFHQPGIMALIPIMVPKKHLNRVNSITYFLNSIIFLVGPIIAAFLFKFLAIHHILWIDAGTFALAVIPLIFISIPKVINEKPKAEEKSSFFADFKEGFSFIREKEGLLSLLSAFTGANLFIIPLFTLMNLFIYSTHGGGETELAYVLAFNQAGTIAGSLLFILWKGFKKNVHGVIIGLATMYVGFMFLTFSPEGLFWFIGIGFLIMGFGLPMANISSQTIWQTVVPKDKLGRVMSVRIAIAQFTSPLGMILSGVIADGISRMLSLNMSEDLAEALSIKYLYIGSAALGMLFLAISWFFTNMRHVERNIIEIEAESTLEDEKLKKDLEFSLDTESSPNIANQD